MKTKLLLQKLAKRFPKRYAKMNHDYVGLMTGKLPEEVHSILLCLDFDQEVLPLIEAQILSGILNNRILKFFGDKDRDEVNKEIQEMTPEELMNKTKTLTRKNVFMVRSKTNE